VPPDGGGVPPDGGGVPPDGVVTGGTPVVEMHSSSSIHGSSPQASSGKFVKSQFSLLHSLQLNSVSLQ
jgi:hypothetical protein